MGQTGHPAISCNFWPDFAVGNDPIQKLFV
nr:MAG TPA: ATP synthase subunit alpha [Caudoviricetes sp.]